jgi:hypothetical protein
MAPRTRVLESSFVEVHRESIAVGALSSRRQSPVGLNSKVTAVAAPTTAVVIYGHILIAATADKAGQLVETANAAATQPDSIDMGDQWIKALVTRDNEANCLGRCLEHPAQLKRNVEIQRVLAVTQHFVEGDSLEPMGSTLIGNRLGGILICAQKHYGGVAVIEWR